MPLRAATFALFCLAPTLASAQIPPYQRVTLQAPSIGSNPTQLQVADLDADGDDDLVCHAGCRSEDDGSLVWYRNPGRITGAWDPTPIAHTGRGALALVDWNFDAAVDVVAADPAGTVVWINDGRGAFTTRFVLQSQIATDIATGEDAAGTHVAVADGSGTVRVHTARESLPPSMLTHHIASGVAEVVVADVDADGALDLATAGFDDGNWRATVRVHRNRSPQPGYDDLTVLVDGAGGTNNAPPRLGFAHLDADRTVPYLHWSAGGLGAGDARRTDGATLQCEAEACRATLVSVAPSEDFNAVPLDIDGDGDTDLVGGSHGATTTTMRAGMLVNEGAFPFAYLPLQPETPGMALLPLEIDGDGHRDLLSLRAFFFTTRVPSYGFMDTTLFVFRDGFE
jgi:hypothetical protein